MKKISLFLILTAICTALCINASAKKGIPAKDIVTSPEAPADVMDDGEPDILWWFDISIKIDPKTRSIEIVAGSSKVQSGSKKVFAKAIWKGIARKRVVIGPFPCKQQAEDASLFYKKNREKVVGVPHGQASRLYWFNVSFNELKRIGAYEYKENPAQVASGSYNEFKEALFEGITFQQLSVGPFADYMDEKQGIAVEGDVWAEKAKSIYRENQ
ncbi:MAG: hypothetical protein IKS00_01190 [Bacteroidales bacterium]|nr:hypothetical protein [Bacteroidales bacterium]